MIERGWQVVDAHNNRRLGTVGAISETKSMHSSGNRSTYEFFVEWEDGSEGWVGEDDVIATGRCDPSFPPVAPK